MQEFHLVAHSSDSRTEEIIEIPVTPTSFSGSPSVPRTSTKPSRPALRGRNSSYFKASPRRFVGKTGTPSSRFSFEDAQWYQRLPDKVQQKHFTKDEQRELAGRRSSWILDAADESVLRAGRQRIHSVPTLGTSYSYSSSASSVHTLEDERPIDSAVDMDESFFDGFRWMNDDDDLDLTLDDYHSHLAASTEPACRRTSRRPSFQRSFSLTALPHVEVHRPLSREANVRVPPLPEISPRTSSQRGSSRSRTRHHDIAPTQPLRITDQPAKHYQDPEARLKLRVYLASPSKFDEALEFGFPSLESSDNFPEHGRPSISRNHYTEPILPTFYDSENHSFLDSFDSDSDDRESLPEISIPNTPPDGMFFRNPHRLPTPKPPSSDLERPFWKLPGRLNVKPVDPQYGQHHQPYVVPGCNREMTLRMTLTRPDLRASDELLYGTGDNDPLALEQLPLPSTRDDIWEQPKETGGTMKNFWKKLSKR
ncbi:MAG: hypothetical protein Q9212_005039 [Teloschistes hypoglaucus]